MEKETIIALRDKIMLPVINFVNSFEEVEDLFTAVAMVLEEGCAKFNLDVTTVSNTLNSLIKEVNETQGKYESINFV